MSDTTIGLLHPGEMGAAVAGCLAARGLPVLWAAAGRGGQTAGRAAAAGLHDAGTAPALAGRADVVLSVCPPHAALDVARSVTGFGGLFVDANAVSPATAREVARVIEAGGGSYVDGGIIGPPPVSAGTTRLYLSGGGAKDVAALFEATPLDARVLAGECSASALKQAYAAWTKGSAALLLTARSLAGAAGVEDQLLAEWEMSQPGLAARWESAQRSAASKGWRWVDEMEQIAASMSGAGLPDGFHRAAADVFARFRRDAGPAGQPARGVRPVRGQQPPRRSAR